MKLKLKPRVKLKVKLRMNERVKLEVKQRVKLNLKVRRRVNLKVLVDPRAKLSAPTPSQKLNGTWLLPTGPLEPLRKVRKSRLDIHKGR